MSVILQVGYFKLTGGKRLFRMSPIHHHFELGGWDEEKITIRFWIIGILAALLGVTLFLASLDRLRVTAMTTRGPTIDLDALTLDAIRAGALRDRPVTVLGLARSGIALARFLADAGARVTVYDGRPADELARRDRRARGPDGDPGARTGRRSARRPGRRPTLVATSPSINPTSRRPSRVLRAALRGARRGARRRATRRVPALVSESGPVPAAVPGADDRGDRHEGQDHDLLADRGHPRRRPGPPGRPRRQHRHCRSSSGCSS